MIIDEKIKNEKLQYDINREAEKISALSSSKIDKYEYLQVKKYYSQIKEEWQDKLNLHIIVLIKHQKNKQKTVQDKEENQIKAPEN